MVVFGIVPSPANPQDDAPLDNPVEAVPVVPAECVVVVQQPVHAELDACLAKGHVPAGGAGIKVVVGRAVGVGLLPRFEKPGTVNREEFTRKGVVEVFGDLVIDLLGDFVAVGVWGGVGLRGCGGGRSGDRRLSGSGRRGGCGSRGGVLTGRLGVGRRVDGILRGVGVGGGVIGGRAHRVVRIFLVILFHDIFLSEMEP